MKFIKATFILTFLLLQTACSMTPNLTENTTHLTTESAELGKIVNIKLTKKKVSWKTGLVGSLLGWTVGNVISESGGARFAGAIVGGNVADSLYGDEFDEITIEDEQGHQYSAIVRLNDFTIQERVLFKLENNKLVAVSKL